MPKLNFLPGVLPSLLIVAACHPALAMPIENIEVQGKYPDNRLDQNLSAVVTIDHNQIQNAPAPTTDDILSELPGVGLFRRTDSRVAHPTTQGVTVRNIGPNAAGRTLVLMDGIPLNDPFGGWVAWQRVPAFSLERIEVLKGGTAGSWGSAALGGVINLVTRDVTQNGVELQGSAGTKGSYDLSGDAHQSFGAASVTASGSYYHTDGYYNLRPADRGTIDRPLDLTSYTGRLGTALTLDSDTKLKLWGDYFHEARGNGTPLAHNSSRNIEAAMSLVHSPGPRSVNWQFNAYIDSGKFNNEFTSVSSDRTSETPALNQYDVPSRAIGLSATVSVPVAETATLEAGSDARFLTGTTHELVQYSNGAFQKNQTAGGAQNFAGAFLSYHWQPTKRFDMSATSRLDYWQNRDGEQIATSVASGATLSNQSFPNQHGWQANGALAASYAVTSSVRLRADAYTGFRVPAINELYRPFRVRNDITEANPNLKNEKLTGVEGGLKWQPTPAVTLDGDVFYNRLNNAVANVTLTTTPGFYAPLGVFVPAGGSLAQRQNLARVNVLGIEGSLKAAIAENFHVTLGYMYSHARVALDVTQTALQGKIPAEIPTHEVSLGIDWQPVPAMTVTVQSKYESNQFDDDLNRERLGSYFETDLGASYRVNSSVTLFADIENLFDRTNIVAISSDNLQTIGTPRLFRLGVRVSTFD